MCQVCVGTICICIITSMYVLFIAFDANNGKTWGKFMVYVFNKMFHGIF